jgi:hypothetical protein
MSLLAICFILRKLVTLWLFVLPLQICSLLLVYVSICFLSIIRVCKTIFTFLSISDGGTARYGSYLSSCKSSLYEVAHEKRTKTPTTVTVGRMNEVQ